MKRVKIDIQIPDGKTPKEKTVTYGSRLPETLNIRILKIPSEDRTKLGIEFWSNVAKVYGV